MLTFVTAADSLAVPGARPEVYFVCMEFHSDCRHVLSGVQRRIYIWYRFELFAGYCDGAELRVEGYSRQVKSGNKGETGAGGGKNLSLRLRFWQMAFPQG